VRKKERAIRRRERWEWRDEVFWLREQQGLSPPAMPEYLSSDEEDEKESDGGQAPPERSEPAPPSPRATEAAEEQVPGSGAEAPTAGRSTEEAERAAGASGGATVAATAMALAPTEPSRKRKQGFSTLR
jgi:hypothetical protein